ncbi:hypothetical protein EVAR_29546_1 [Eumeta japonica]|uniref:Uncharacterized protein n=1 Tax=Eumeta variegata TaxID=151549 RepID=A0A4C1WFR8_EUMVA|nr:hypothetical protein EVAR_29546_1 [Eumeta japonica]
MTHNRDTMGEAVGARGRRREPPAERPRRANERPHRARIPKISRNNIKHGRPVAVPITCLRSLCRYRRSCRRNAIFRVYFRTRRKSRQTCKSNRSRRSRRHFSESGIPCGRCVVSWTLGLFYDRIL